LDEVLVVGYVIIGVGLGSLATPLGLDSQPQGVIFGFILKRNRWKSISPAPLIGFIVFVVGTLWQKTSQLNNRMGNRQGII